MKKSIIITIIIVIAILGVIGWLVGFYNGLVKMEKAIEGQWAQVENQYQRRFDLIPNLVNSVKGMMKQEQEVFGKIAEARTHYAGARTLEEKVGAANQVESALARLLVIMENYPQLKSAENVQTLMIQLEGTENRISVERGRFNDRVQEYNIRIKQFPGNILAPMFGFSAKEFFGAAAGAEVAPKVEL